MPSDPVETARAFVEEHFPEATVALVAGSVIRGDATSTSDLDIVVISDRADAPFRASYVYRGWPIEVFVHTKESLPLWIAKDGDRERPSMAMMVTEGVLVRGDEGQAGRMKDLAGTLLERGPQRLSPESIEDWRYSLTDVLDDFLGVDTVEEGMFVANDLAVEIADFTLLLRGHWRGRGKWVPRALKRLDATLADQLTRALMAYYRADDKSPLIALAEETLENAGGRLFAGYYRAAPKDG